MATERPVHSEHPAMTFEGMRISWSGIWAGMLVVLGAMFVFSTLGVAVGFSVDAARNVAPDQITGGAVIWSRCSLLVALFLGGMAAARMSMVWDRFTGIAQSALLWVISMLALLLLGKSGVGLIGRRSPTGRHNLPEPIRACRHGSPSSRSSSRCLRP